MNHRVGYLIEAGFKSIGRGVIISPLAVIRSPEKIEIGDNVRIDEFCFIDGGAGLKIGSHVHIASRTTIYSGAGVELGDFSTLSSYVLLQSESDDYSGESLIGPQFNRRRFKPGYISPGPIVIGKFAAIGARSTIMPGVRLDEGVAVGAHSLVLKSIDDPWTINVGVPARYLKPRSRKMIEISNNYLDWYRNGERNAKAPWA